jgi:hypothetical protein
MKTTGHTLSSIVSTYVAEGGELMAWLSDEDQTKREEAINSLAHWLGRFQIEAGRAMRQRKAKA